MATFPLVSLPAGLKLPGVYTQVNLNGAGLTASPNNKVLLWHYVGAGAPADLFTARQVISQAQVDALCKSWSPLAHMFAAAVSQLPQGLGSLPEPSSGSVRSAKIKILGKASDLLLDLFGTDGSPTELVTLRVVCAHLRGLIRI